MYPGKSTHTKKQSASPPWSVFAANNTYKIYSVARLDVFKLCHLHPAQVMKRFFIFLPQ